MRLRREYGSFSLDFDSESITVKEGHPVIAISKGLGKDDLIGAIIRFEDSNGECFNIVVTMTMSSLEGGVVMLAADDNSYYYNPETGLVSNNIDSIFTYDAIAIENGAISPMYLKPGMNDSALLSIPVTVDGETVSVVKNEAPRPDAIVVKKETGVNLFAYYPDSGKLELLYKPDSESGDDGK